MLSLFFSNSSNVLYVGGNICCHYSSQILIMCIMSEEYILSLFFSNSSNVLYVGGNTCCHYSSQILIMCIMSEEIHVVIILLKY